LQEALSNARHAAEAVAAVRMTQPVPLAAPLTRGPLGFRDLAKKNNSEVSN